MTTAELRRPKEERLWTYDEMVAELPETNLPIELWNGKIIMCPAPTPNHQDIVLSFAERLKGFVAKGKLGKVYISPVDVVLTSHRVVQPDVLFITKSRLQIVKRHIAGIPDLVVEVISEGTWQRDRIQKKALYEQFGLPEYWIVDPDSRTIEIFTLANGGYQLHAKGSDAERVKSKLLPGFQVSFAELNR